jgi:hypothetical protein
MGSGSTVAKAGAVSVCFIARNMKNAPPTIASDVNSRNMAFREFCIGAFYLSCCMKKFPPLPAKSATHNSSA